MKSQSLLMRALGLFLAILLALPLEVLAQEGDNAAPAKKVSREELAQILAPIALYPDDLVAQILMASTYPLEVVQADRWAQQNKGLKGDALAKALEQQKWDPSVKSLVNFPEVLSAMSQKLDLTTSVGDAYLAQPKEVMAVIQDLRKKAQDAGNLKSTKEQKVVVEKETIVIQPANPQVVYVPSYNPTVVYGTWPYPSYPPYAYYPPPAYPGLTLATGVAVGMAWGYAWGNCNWGGGHVDYNVNRNTNINANINRSRYTGGGRGRGAWQHNPAHRRNVAYRDNGTARKYGQARGGQARTQSPQARRDARGYGGGGRGAGGAGAGSGRTGAAAARPATGATGARGGAAARSTAAAPRGRDTAFGGSYGSGRQERTASSRGAASRQSFGGGGGAARGGGGFRGGGGGGGRGGRR
jgi:hypothetical protein